MNTLNVGYSQVNINPMLGIGIAGYYVPRYAKGFLDDLEASALALSCGESRVLLICVDHLGIKKEQIDRFQEAISNCSGVRIPTLARY